MIRASLWMIALAVAALSQPAKAGFSGTLELMPAGCETTGECTLKEAFGYIDPQGIGWEAKKGLLTDGASIPSWAQPFIGQPFDKSFIKAAVIHDHYCDRHVRPWRQTHRVFYDALLESGVSKSKAGKMYFAVLVGGPKWVKLVKGKPCALGHACINSVEIGASMPSTSLSIGEESGVFLARDELYGTARFDNIMAAKIPELDKKGEALTREEVELEAAKAMAGDLYFTNGEEIGGDLGVTLDFK